MQFRHTARFSAILAGMVFSSFLLANASAAFADNAPPPIGYVGVVPKQWPQQAETQVQTQTEAPAQKPALPLTTSALAVTATSHEPPNPANPERETETLISATRMNFDQNTNIATAAGHVEIARGGYVLHADKVIYDQNKDIMHAEGHVALLHPGGEVSFADEEEITGDMKQAFVKNLGVLFPDNSRMAARQGQRYDGRYLVADTAMFTACNVCTKDPNNPPLWQLKADQIVHDNDAHNIYYHDATLDFMGTPVLYSPYLSTPDPTVTRRQGFLSPNFGKTVEAGYFTRIPYYFDISPDKDAVFSPIFSSNDVAAFNGEYRERFANGRLQLDGLMGYSDLLSETNGVDKGEHWRGNLTADFLYEINNDWRAGSQIDYVSDKSFLSRYNLGTPASTESRAFLERFHGRNYASINTYYFQDLQPGTQPVQPVIIPQTNFSMLGEPGQTLGGRWSLDGSTLITHRDNSSADIIHQGPDTRRASLSGGWERQLVSDTGLVTTVDGLLRGDGYWADNVVNPNGSGQTFNNVLIGRQFEQASITSGYPLGRHGDGYQQILEPLVMLSAAPEVKQDPRQPIEDSLDLQLDDTNLFANNRFTGTDLIEGGSRVTYGLRQSYIADGGAHLDIFGGQSYDFARNGQFSELSGLHDHSSDYVGRINASPGEWLNFDYNFRFSHHDLSPEAQDAHLSFGPAVFRPSLRYVLAYQTETTGVVDTIEEGIVGFSSTFAKYWTLVASHTQGFQPQPGPRQTSVALNYGDECFMSGVTVQRSDINRFDIKPGTSFLFHIYLKNVGGAHTDSMGPLSFSPQFRQTE